MQPEKTKSKAYTLRNVIPVSKQGKRETFVV